MGFGEEDFCQFGVTAVGTVGAYASKSSATRAGRDFGESQCIVDGHCRTRLRVDQVDAGEQVGGSVQRAARCQIAKKDGQRSTVLEQCATPAFASRRAGDEEARVAPADVWSRTRTSAPSGLPP